MVLRMATLEDRFPSLSQMTVFPDTWPSGQVPYLFGASFTAVYRAKIRQGKTGRPERELQQARFPLPRRIHGKEHIRKDYYAISIMSGRTALREQIRKTARGRHGERTYACQPLTHKGYQTLSPVYSPDGRRIAYFEANGDEFRGIYVMNADGTGDRKIVENFFPSSASGTAASWSPDGNRLYYTKAEIVRNTKLYDDIYFYDFRRKKEVRVTKGLRARDPDVVAATAGKLVFVTNRMGMTQARGARYFRSRKKPAGKSDDILFDRRERDPVRNPAMEPGRIENRRGRLAAGRVQGHLDPRRGREGSSRRSARSRHRRIACPGVRTGPFFTLLPTGREFTTSTPLSWRPGNCIRSPMCSAAPSRRSLRRDNKNLVYTSYSSKGYDIHTMAVDRAELAAGRPDKGRLSRCCV